jgi:hypothetical protein
MSPAKSSINLSARRQAARFISLGQSFDCFSGSFWAEVFVSSCSRLNGFSMLSRAEKFSTIDHDRSEVSSRKSYLRSSSAHGFVLALISRQPRQERNKKKEKHKTVLFRVVELPQRLKLSYCNKSLAVREKENWCCSCGGADVAVGKKSRRKPSCRLKVLCSRLHEVTIGC